MFDFTIEKEVKDNYIVDAILNDDETYTLVYASGRKETYPFSIHNFQVELYKMEEQYKLYGEDYLNRINPNEGIRTFLVGLMLVVDVLHIKSMIENGINAGNTLCLAYILYISVPRLFEHIKNKKLAMKAKKRLAVIKFYLENKDEFKVNIPSSMTKTGEDWYLVNMGNIDQFSTEEELKEYMSTLTHEKKEHEVKKLLFMNKNNLEVV